MTPQPNFLRPQRGPHPLAWWACALGLAVLGHACLEANSAWRERSSARALLALPAAAPAPPSRTDTEARRAVLQAQQALNRPWPAAFAALEAALPAGVRWLTLDIGESGVLRLEGLAADPGQALAAAAALREPWRNPVAGRIEAGGAATRFEVTARWAEVAR